MMQIRLVFLVLVVMVMFYKLVMWMDLDCWYLFIIWLMPMNVGERICVGKPWFDARFFALFCYVLDCSSTHIEHYLIFVQVAFVTKKK